MSVPIHDKEKQLSYIKGKLKLITYMVDQLEHKNMNAHDFYNVEIELRDLLKKTRLFQNREKSKS